VPEDEPLAIDGTMQRFEFTFERFWKAVRRLRRGKASRPTVQKAVLQQAYRLGWLD